MDQWNNTNIESNINGIFCFICRLLYHSFFIFSSPGYLHWISSYLEPRGGIITGYNHIYTPLYHIHAEWISFQIILKIVSSKKIMKNNNKKTQIQFLILNLMAGFQPDTARIVEFNHSILISNVLDFRK